MVPDINPSPELCKEASDNDVLTNLDGLNGLTSIPGKLIIANNTSLSDLKGLGQLSSIGTLEISGKQAFSDLFPLKNLTEVDSLNIYQTNFTGIEGLVNITSIKENLNIALNDALVNLDGLENITSVGNLYIYANNQLMGIDGLRNVTSLSSLTIMWNDALSNLDGLENLTFMDTSDLLSIQIFCNANLPSEQINQLKSQLVAHGWIQPTCSMDDYICNDSSYPLPHGWCNCLQIGAMSHMYPQCQTNPMAIIWIP